MPEARQVLKPAAWSRLLLGLACLFAATAGRADTHALILTIGQYAQPSAKLRGIEVDARLAQQMALRLGATRPEQRVVLSDRQLDFFSLRAAVRGMRQRLRPGDTLIVYFSGHGKRMAKAEGAGCQEGLVTVEGRLYMDALLRDDLEALAAIAARVIVFNDSCHSGGAVTKRFGSGPEEELQPKVYPADVQPMPEAARSDAAADDASCARIGNPVIKSFRALADAPADRLLYLAASSDDQAAYASSQGSLATRAWHACLNGAAQDLDGDGQINGGELARCAQGWLRTTFPDWPQDITPQFNTGMNLLPAGAARR